MSVSPASAQIPGEAKLNVAHSLPPIAPSWVDGYLVRWPVRVLGDPAKQPEAQTVLVRLPAGCWFKPDASDIAVQGANGKLIPAAVLSHDPRGDTIVQFPRSGNDPWYWIYGVSPKGLAGPKADPKTLREGVTLELRDWLGDDLSSWAKVRSGLEKSGSVIGNAIVTDVFQNCCPSRPNQSRKFAASYRGHLLIKKEGAYRFVVNADDAALLLIDGFKVYERTGVNKTLDIIKIKELESWPVKSISSRVFMRSRSTRLSAIGLTLMAFAPCSGRRRAERSSPTCSTRRLPIRFMRGSPPWRRRMANALACSPVASTMCSNCLASSCTWSGSKRKVRPKITPLSGGISATAPWARADRRRMFISGNVTLQ